MDVAALGRAAGKDLAASENAHAVLRSLDLHGKRYGLDQPHRLAHYLSQLMHESMGFTFDKEIWGPTPAQKRYEGRADLGNLIPGDGSKFRGRGPIQVTGRTNYAAFRDWCRRVDALSPDFEAYPDLVCANPWEGLAPIWYWSTRNLGAIADRDGDQVAAITRVINGGSNGLADRERYYTRTALVLLGYAPDAVSKAQADLGLKVDGKAGPATRAALHSALKMRAPEKAAPITNPINPQSPWAGLWRAILAAIGR